jgi:DNA polymerase elongation subunit (family B)
MTTRLPDGTIRLLWDEKEEVVAPGDLDGWTSIEAIPRLDVPEVSTEVPPTLVLDIETTGLDPNQHSVVAVGLALYQDGREEVCEVLRDADERALLSRTFERVREVAPRGGVLTGYNILDFDLRFLSVRSQRLDLVCPFQLQQNGRGEVVVRKVAASAGIISSDPITYIPFKNNLGLQIVDAFHLVARYEFTKRALGAHKDLKSVAGHFGVAERDRVVIPHGKICEATPEELEKYVKGDLRETYRVYARLVRPYLVVSRLTSLPLEDVATRSPAWVWESLLERHYRRTEKPEEKRDYPGGLVVSRPGLYYPCAKLDVASLYPTIMLAYSIHSQKDTDAYALSWLRSLTEKRLELKERAKKGDEEAKVVQEGLKVLLNSLYGFYGTGGYGFNDMHAARRVTELGRKLLVKMIAAIEDAGGVVVEADTDGVIARAHDPQQILAAAQQALPQPFRVDVEWTDSIVFVSDRKNYIVLHKEGGVITVKGAKWRGRDKEAIWTKFPREFLRRWILQDRDAAMEYAKEIEGEITSGRGWDWVTRTHRVSASDKYLLEAGFNEGEVATYTYRDKRRRIVSRSPQDGYDAAHYAKMLRIVVQEITGVIGRA